MDETPALVNKKYLLEKYPGKGGWTYALIPEIKPDKSAPFGWVRVRGFIDGYEIRNYHLMPMGNGQLFLPVKASIRKKIGKKAGDLVEVILFEDRNPVQVPEELKLCLEDYPAAHQFFLSLKEGQKKEYIDWIFSAKTDETKVQRISEAITKLENGQVFRD